MADVKVAGVSEIAQYADGKTVHCALARGHNNGLDEAGVNHQEIFEQRRDEGELPFITQGIRVTPVVEHSRDGVKIDSHWRSKPEDIEMFITGGEGGEGAAHRMAKQACLELIAEGSIRRIIRGGLPQGFSPDGYKTELSIQVGDDTYFADVAAWDDRFPDVPIVFEITDTSGQKAKRLKAMSDQGIRVYEIVIGPKVRTAARNGVEINVGFFRSIMLKSNFRLRNGASTNCALTHYIRVKEAEQAALWREQEALRSEQVVSQQQDSAIRLSKSSPAKPAVKPAPVVPKKDRITPAVEYVRKNGADVSANRMLDKIRSLRGKSVFDYCSDEAAYAAYNEIRNMSPIRAIHIDQAREYYGVLLAHD